MKNVLGIIFAMLLCVYAAQMSFGTAATAPINTPMRTGLKVSVGVYTNTIIYQGTMVCLNSSGYAIPAADASGNIVIGRATKTVDNRTTTSGSGDSGSLTIEVERGIFGWKQTGSAISDTSIGSLAYVFDDNLVTNASSGNAIIAGVIVDYDGTYVWVDTYHIGRTVGSFTTLAASGATTLSGVVTASSNLTVGGNETIAGTLGVKGTSSLTNVTVSGVLTMAGPAAITNAGVITATSYNTASGPGISIVVTNAMVGTTNIMTFVNGLLTVNVFTP